MTKAGSPAPSLPVWAELVRRQDPDRFFTALFAPPDRRAALLLLYAFNVELARAREVASQPLLALIRLNWWREVVLGERKRHEIATPLSEAIASGALVPGELAAMIDARAAEAEEAIPDRGAFAAYLDGTEGTLAVAAGRLLGLPEPEVLRPLGCVVGLAGQLRRVGSLAARGRCQLPQDVLAEHGLTTYDVIADPRGAKALAAMRELAAAGLTGLQHLRLPRPIIAAALPAVLARRDLRRLPNGRAERGLVDRLAVIAAGLRSRV